VTRAVVARLPDGSVELRSWPPWTARVLDEAVELARPDVPAGPGRDRLLQPAATDDPLDAAEWRLRVHPELFALFAASHAVVAADLAQAKRTPRGGLRLVHIPRDHVPAWIACLNAARLRLGAEHDVDAAAMAAPLDELPEERRAAVVRIDLLGIVEEHLISGIDRDEGGAEPAAPPEPTEPAA
jgi:hypothetical protein